MSLRTGRRGLGRRGVLVRQQLSERALVWKSWASDSSSSIWMPRSLSRKAARRIESSESICSGSSGSLIGGKGARGVKIVLSFDPPVEIPDNSKEIAAEELLGRPFFPQRSANMDVFIITFPTHFNRVTL